MTILVEWYRKQQAAVPKQLGDHDKLPDTDVVEVVLQMSKEGKLNEPNPNRASERLANPSESLNL